MSSRRISVNNHFNKNNQNKEEKIILKYKYQLKNKNNISNTIKDDKQNKTLVLKNSEINRNNIPGEDEYNCEIYNKPISLYKNYLLKSNYDKKYNTISTFNSFQIKYKTLPLFNRLKKNRLKNEYQNFNFIDIDSGLNFSFEGTIKNNIFLAKEPKLVYKNKINFEKIIHIFDKTHKKINYKTIFNKCKNIKIAHRYNKYKKICKFSKKNKNKELTKNCNNINESYNRSDSQNCRELYKRKDKMNEINLIINTDKKYDNDKKDEQTELSEVNSIKSIAKNLFNKNSSDNQSTSSKSNQFNKNYDLYDKDKKYRNQNISIGLIKKNEEKNIEPINSKDNINNNSNTNNNSSIRFRYSNRKSKSILEDNNANKNNKDNASILKKEKNENLEKNPSKYIFRKLDNSKNDKKLEENVKEKKNHYNFKNRYITNNFEKSDINNNKNIKDKIDTRKNNIQNASQSNIRKAYISNISLISSNTKAINISNNNRRRNNPISINNNNIIKYDNNNKIILNNSNSRKNSLDKKNRNEITKIKLEKSIFHSPQISSGNMLGRSKICNSNRSINNIIQVKDSTKLIDNKIILSSRDQKNYRANLANNRSCIAKEEINDNTDKKEKINNYNKILLNKNSQSRKYINIVKPKLNTDRSDKNQEIKMERKILTRRESLSKNNEEKINLHNYSTNPNGYKFINKDDKNSLTSTYISNDTNKIENKNVIINENNKIYIPESQHSNKFHRSNHKYHEIKSTSSDKNAKLKENEIQIYEKIKKKVPQLVYSTSMDNIRCRRNKYKEKEENIYINQIKIKDMRKK